MAKRWAEKLILAKLEASAGAAEALAAADAILCKNVEHAPLAGGTVERELERPYFGASEAIPVNVHETLSFDVELAGSGAAGTAPAYGKLLQACGFAETVTVNTDVAYTLVSAGEKSLTLSLNIDGVLHTMTECRGNVSFEVVADQIPMLKFAFVGRRGASSDKAAVASPVYSMFKDPQIVNHTNTPTFELHGVSTLPLSSFTYDVGVQVDHRSIVNGPEVLIGDRKGSGALTVDRVALAKFDPVDRAVKVDKGALKLVHGVGAGKIIDIAMPNVQFNTVEHANNEGAWQGAIGYKALPKAAAGNDELTLKVK